MTMFTLSPAHVIAALNSVENDWPDLVGSKWPEIEPQYHALRAQVESTTGPSQMRATAELVELFAPYAAGRERLNDALKAQTEGGRIMLSLADLGRQLGLDPAVIARLRNAAQPGSSHRFIWQSGPTKATSLKLSNVWINFECGAFCEFLSGLITTTIKDVMGESNGLLQASGTLLMIASLYKTTTIKLDEREATVFNGFAKAGREAKEDLILIHANQVRQAVKLRPLDKQELGNALYKMAEIKSIERVKDKPDLWRIIEKHHVKPFP
jgi:hypothetical protein